MAHFQQYPALEPLLKRIFTEQPDIDALEKAVGPIIVAWTGDTKNGQPEPLRILGLALQLASAIQPMAWTEHNEGPRNQAIMIIIRHIATKNQWSPMQGSNNFLMKEPYVFITHSAYNIFERSYDMFKMMGLLGSRPVVRKTRGAPVSSSSSLPVGPTAALAMTNSAKPTSNRNTSTEPSSSSGQHEYANDISRTQNIPSVPPSVGMPKVEPLPVPNGQPMMTLDDALQLPSAASTGDIDAMFRKTDPPPKAKTRGSGGKHAKAASTTRILTGGASTQ